MDIRRLRVVHYRSSSEAAAAAIGGHVDLVVTHPAALLAQARAGRLRPLAVSAPRRLEGELAQAPTWRELGVDAVFSNVRAVIGPRGLRPEPIRYWESVFSRIAASEEWQRELALHYRSEAFLGHEAARAAWRRLREDISQLLFELGLGRR